MDALLRMLGLKACVSTSFAHSSSQSPNIGGRRGQEGNMAATLTDLESAFPHRDHQPWGRAIWYSLHTHQSCAAELGKDVSISTTAIYLNGQEWFLVCSSLHPSRLCPHIPSVLLGSHRHVFNFPTLALSSSAFHFPT